MGRAKKKKKPAGLTAGRVVLIAFLGALFLFLSGAWYFLNVYTPSFPDLEFPDLGGWVFSDNGRWFEEGMEGEEYPGLLDFGEWVAVDRNRGDSFMFLIIGLDEWMLTDTLMMAHFNVRDSEISLLSIPRDSWINNSFYTGRINAAYARGFNAARSSGRSREEAYAEGMNFLRRVIQFTFGLPVDAYISLDLAAFKLLVDEVGGVYMDVPMRMRYSDPWADPPLHIDIEPGWQRLSGAQAEGVVRFRGREGDIGRMATQQRFLAALARQMIRFDVPQMRRVSGILADNVTTNLTAANILWFAARATDVGLDNIKMHVLPGEPATTRGGASVWSLYRAETMQIINGFYNPHREDIPEGNFNIFELSRRYGANPPHINLEGVTMGSLIGD